ncbi:MAG: hypothetical protein IMZ46_17180, partial [Acidobacteria bacterium]|nr:hypothetical protein [Acidobacteriota bacterium]
MPRRPGDGRHGGGGAQRKRLVVAYAALFLASCANLVDAATPQHNPHHQTRAAEPLAHIHRQVAADDLDDAARGWAAHTAVQPGSVKSHPNNRYKDSAESSSSAPRDDDIDNPRDQHTRYPPNYQNIVIPNDASALATLAPAQPAVRAPPAGLRPAAPHAPGATGLSSPPSARSLADWEVEDFVLLATVDGDLYASDRKTGERRWQLEVERP